MIPLEQMKLDFSKLKKRQIGEILHLTAEEISSNKKDVLIDKLMNTVDENEIMIRSIYKNYSSHFSLKPTEVEELLQISKTERLRWTHEQKLKVNEYVSFRKWGKTLEYPVYDGYLTRNITQEQIQRWRREHQCTVMQKRKEAAKKAVKTRKKNQNMQKEFYEKEWKQMLLEWYKVNGPLGATLQLAFWTTWVSRWAKEYQLKARRARTKKEEYENHKEILYTMKNKAIKKLCKSPYAKLSFYQPETPHKITYIQFCINHYDLWLQEREFDYVSKWDFYRSYEKSISQCKSCVISAIEDYYSMYYLSIEHDELKDYHFSFHTPYPIGKEFLPNKDELIKEAHEEQEGIFRFGRALFAEEKIVFKLKEVIRYFDEAMKKYDLYIK